MCELLGRIWDTYGISSLISIIAVLLFLVYFFITKILPEIHKVNSRLVKFMIITVYWILSGFFVYMIIFGLNEKPSTEQPTWGDLEKGIWILPYDTPNIGRLHSWVDSITPSLGNPSNAYQRGLLRIGQGAYDKSLVELTYALDHMPESDSILAKCHFFKGVAYHCLDSHESAKISYELALECTNSKYYMARYKHSRLLADMGLYNEALESADSIPGCKVPESDPHLNLFNNEQQLKTHIRKLRDNSDPTN